MHRPRGTLSCHSLYEIDLFRRMAASWFLKAAEKDKSVALGFLTFFQRGSRRAIVLDQVDRQHSLKHGGNSNESFSSHSPTTNLSDDVGWVAHLFNPETRT